MIERALLPLLAAEGEDESDIVTVRGLRAGGHRAVASHPDFGTSYAWRIDIPAVVDPDWIMMGRSAHVEGIVIRKSDRAPIPGARVEIRQLINGQSHGDSCSVLTDEAGRFSCPNAWGTDDARFDGRVMCWKDGYGAQMIPYGFLKPGDRKSVVFELEEAAPFHGRVEFTSGEPAAGIDVAICEDMVYIESTKTGLDGSFTIHSMTKDRGYYAHVHGKGVSTLFATTPSPWPTEWPHVLEVDPTFRVEGRLIADGYPLKGAKVRACLETGRVTRTVDKWVDADPDTGRFAFDELPAGQYYFDAVAAGHSHTRATGYDLGAKPRGDPIEIRMSRGARVRGVVRDARSGSPIGGASVKLADFGELQTRHQYGTIDLGIETDEKGGFEIESVEPGRTVSVFVEKSGYAPSLDRFEVTVGASVAEREIELQIGGSLSVNVIRPDGLPVGDFSVDITSPETGYRRITGRGSAVAKDLPPGKFIVTVATREPDADYWGAMREFHDVEVVAGETTTLDVSFAEGSVIRGAIVGDVAANTKGGFAAYVREVGGSKYPWQAEVKWNSRTFAVYGVPPGRYEILAESLDRQPRLAAERTIELRPDVPCFVEFDFGEYQLEGSITDPVGSPVAGAVIYLEPKEPTIPSPDGATNPRSRGAMAVANSTVDGKYTVAGLFPGTYRAEVRARGFAYAIDRVTVDERELVRRRDFQLEPMCSFRVFVADRGGARVADPRVAVRHASDPDGEDLTPATVDSDGAHVVRGIGTGNYRVEVRAPGRFVWRATVACIGGESRDVAAALRRFSRLHVDLRDAFGAALKNVGFSLVDLESGELVSDWIARGDVMSTNAALATDEKGRLRIDGIPEGRYRVVGFGIDGEVGTTFDPEEKPTTLVAAR